MSVLTLMAQNEKLVGELYRRYSSRFPECSELWERLAKDEDRHTNWLLKQQDNIEKGLLTLTGKRFNESAVKTFTDYLQGEIDKLRNEEISLINALSISLYIEESLIEHKYFETLESDSIEIKNTLNKLKNETEAHLQRIKEVWLRYR